MLLLVMPLPRVTRRHRCGYGSQIFIEDSESRNRQAGAVTRVTSINILIISEGLLGTLSFPAKCLLQQYLCPTALIEYTNEGEKGRLS